MKHITFSRFIALATAILLSANNTAPAQIAQTAVVETFDGGAVPAYFTNVTGAGTWSIVNDGTGNNVLQATGAGSASPSAYAVLKDSRIDSLVSNFEVSANLASLANTGSANIGFNLTADANNAPSYYYAGIIGGGASFLHIRKVTPSGGDVALAGVTIGTDKGFVKVVKDGNNIKVFLNGVLKLDFTDTVNPLTGGTTTGFVAGPGTMQFDNYSVVKRFPVTFTIQNFSDPDFPAPAIPTNWAVHTAQGFHSGFTTDTFRIMVLTPGIYTYEFLTAALTGSSFTFEVGFDGMVSSVACSSPTPFASCGVSALTVNPGFKVTVARNFSANFVTPNWRVDNIFPFTTADSQSFSMIPGIYTFTPSIGTPFLFSVNPDGTISSSACSSSTPFATCGQGTASQALLTVNGFPLTVNSKLGNTSWRVDNVFPFSTKSSDTVSGLLPGSFPYSFRTGALESFNFEIGVDGKIQGAPDTFLVSGISQPVSGNGIGTLTVGMPPTITIINGTSIEFSSLSIIGLNLAPGYPNPTTVPTSSGSFTLSPGTYSLFGTDPSKVFSFTVNADGSVTSPSGFTLYNSADKILTITGFDIQFKNETVNTPYWMLNYPDAIPSGNAAIPGLKTRSLIPGNYHSYHLYSNELIYTDGGMEQYMIDSTGNITTLTGANLQGTIRATTLAKEASVAGGRVDILRIRGARFNLKNEQTVDWQAAQNTNVLYVTHGQQQEFGLIPGTVRGFQINSNFGLDRLMKWSIDESGAFSPLPVFNGTRTLNSDGTYTYNSVEVPIPPATYTITPADPVNNVLGTLTIKGFPVTVINQTGVEIRPCLNDVICDVPAIAGSSKALRLMPTFIGFSLLGAHATIPNFFRVLLDDSGNWQKGETGAQNYLSGFGTPTLTVGAAACNITADAGPDVIICSGQSTTLSASATGGSSPYSFLWSNGTTAASSNGMQVVSPAVTTVFTVTVTDSIGCTNTDSVQVSVFSIDITATGAITLCNAKPITLSADSGLTNYVWSTGQTTSSIVTDTAGVYFVSATSPSGCTATDSIGLQKWVDVTIDSIFCAAIDSSGKRHYSFSLNIANAINDTGLVISFTLSQGIVTTSLSDSILPGDTTFTGDFTTEVLSNCLLCFNISIAYPNVSDTCSTQLCFLLPSCSSNVCDSNLLENGTLSDSIVAGGMTGGGNLAAWSAAYGNPVVRDSSGCEENGYIKLKGNKPGGDAIKQSLGSSKKLLQGKKYVLSCCVRIDAAASDISYIKLRAIAFNGALPSGNIHPAPSASIAIIGYSGKITSGDWVNYEFPAWTANKNFDNIAINVYNNLDTALFSAGDIDGLCLRETTDSTICLVPFNTIDSTTFSNLCNAISTDSLGNPILPAGLVPFLDPDNPPTLDTVDMFMGNVSDLYGWCAGTDNDTAIYAGGCLPCATIGGTVPSDVLNIDFNDSLANAGIPVSPDSIQSLLNFTGDSIFQSMDSIPVIFPPLGNIDTACFCDTTAGPPPDPNSPFNGLDIVFVHGLDPGTIAAKILGNDSAKTKWPQDSLEFYNNYLIPGKYGYWKKRADVYWKEHIKQYLINKGFVNRYLVVAWASTQTLPFAAHAMLKQISEAMANGQGVEELKNGTGKHNFGKNGYVIISYSSGGLLTNVAMTLADQEKFGKTKYISGRAKAHIALHSTISGSNYATAAFAASINAPYLLPALNPWLGFAITAITLPTLATSVLRDLVPAVSQLYWMEQFGKYTPVPVLTVSGGHPDELTLLTKHILHKGFDDGIGTIESLCGNNIPSFINPGTYLPVPYPFKANVYDMGIGTLRALCYYVDQVYEAVPSFWGTAIPYPFVSAGAVPFLSPSGMVQPVLLNGLPNSMSRYPNHYSFIQGASDHHSSTILNSPVIGYFSPYPDYYSTPWPFTGGTLALENNYEEVRVIADNAVYSKGLLSNSLPTNQEDVKGLKWTITIKWPWPINKKQVITWWIWKRTYNRMPDYNTMNDVDYVYKYVLK